MTTRGLLARALVLVAAALGAACGSGDGTTATGTASASSGPSAGISSRALSGSLTVFAAASLTEAFRDAETTLEMSNPGFRAVYSFAGSQQLASNIRNGAPADVVATADTTTMQSLVSAGLVWTPRIFARNTLEIAVARGNPRGIRTLRDLAANGLNVVLADPSVPAGRFAAQVLQRAGVTLTPRSLELDVKSALLKVGSHDADAAIVYATDVRAAADGVDGVVIPDAQNVVAEYPVAVVRASRNQAAANAFVTSAVSGEVQRAVRDRGFLAP